jgi:hypothetical protein
MVTMTRRRFLSLKSEDKEKPSAASSPSSPRGVHPHNRDAAAADSLGRCGRYRDLLFFLLSRRRRRIKTEDTAASGVPTASAASDAASEEDEVRFPWG